MSKKKDKKQYAMVILLLCFVFSTLAIVVIKSQPGNRNYNAVFSQTEQLAMVTPPPNIPWPFLNFFLNI